MEPRYATTQMKHYRRIKYAFQKAFERATYRHLDVSVIQTPLGYAVCRADHVGWYDLSGGQVIATCREDGSWCS